MINLVKKSREQWKCDICGHSNDIENEMCINKNCQSEAAINEFLSRMRDHKHSISLSKEAWGCAICTFENNSNTITCKSCEAPKSENNCSICLDEITGTSDVVKLPNCSYAYFFINFLFC